LRCGSAPSRPPAAPHPPPLPTRRSSDLASAPFQAARNDDLQSSTWAHTGGPRQGWVRPRGHLEQTLNHTRLPERHPRTRASQHRSEEHTSELQSRENLVCRLLLGKKTAA